MLKISCNKPKTVLKVNDGMIARVVVAYPCEVVTDGASAAPVQPASRDGQPRFR